MTHPLTPREKVAAVVLDAAAAYLIQQYGASHGLDHEIDRARIMSAIPNDAILTALASGSGDHAELARLAEADKALELAAIRLDEIYEAAEVDDVAYRNEATIHSINGLAGVAQAEIRTFLSSKEAERG